MKRATIAAIFAAGVMLASVAPAAAEWPNDKPIRVVVGFGAGGGTDIVARIVAQPLSELLHQAVVIETSRVPAAPLPAIWSRKPTRTATPPP